MTQESQWSPLGPERVSVGGTLAARARANWNRLQYRAFQDPQIFTNVDSDDWPGDWVARTLHANILLSRVLDEDSGQAARIMGGLRTHMNDHGYFGARIDPHALNEQQLGSPHGWLMRGLIEYHNWVGDDESLALLERLVDRIALPMRDWWATYPVTIGERGRGQGEMVGAATWQWGNWVMSSDIGNQFMLLDGMSQVLEFAPSTELLDSIEAGFRRFLETDLLGTNVQTHATLTTLRALLRVYSSTGDQRYLDAVLERYRLYRERAMTENYANNNWFGRPDTWTEPCAVVDSFIVAVGLWRVAGEARYLEDAHLIWNNAVSRGQRGNGGFGCDSCAGFGGPIIRMRDFYEAFFCCTQRGAEGHATAITSTYHVREDAFAITFPADSVAELELAGGTLTLRQRTSYPRRAHTSIEVVASSVARPVEIHFFVPHWVRSPTLSLNGVEVASRIVDGFLIATVGLTAGDEIVLDGEVVAWARQTINPTSVEGHVVHHWGALVLAHRGDHVIRLPDGAVIVAEEDGGFSVEGTDTVLHDLGDAIEHAPSREVIRSYKQGDYEGWSALLIDEVEGLPRQVLFPEV
ncbi:hypothetical protein [Streptomyces sp. NPDC020917]|uniref:hypothetical protein n=1 Tax=Streptomyces sp. NPDC020917 TaxID=3365102 RepID=UPI0037A1478B